MEKYLPNMEAKKALDKVAGVLNMKSVAMAKDGKEFIVYDQVTGGIAFTMTVDEERLADELDDRAFAIAFDDDYPDFDPSTAISHCYID
jgi:hypothetical protein